MAASRGHAQALHNVEEQLAKEMAKKEGGSAEDQEAARQGVLENPSFKDAPLSKDGECQVDQAASSFAELLAETHHPAPDAVYVSPLERALQTATRLFGPHKLMQAKEFLREKRTGRPCDERKHSSVLRAQFPHVDFSDIVEHDRTTNLGYAFLDPATQTEENTDVQARSEALLEFVKEQEAPVVAVVAHKGFIREFINGPLASLLVAGSKHLRAHAVFEMDQELPPQLAAFLGGGTDPLVLGGIDASFQAVKHKNDIASKSSIAELLVGTKKASLKSNKKKEASIAKQTDVRAAAKVRTDKARRHQIANRNRGIGCGAAPTTGGSSAEAVATSTLDTANRFASVGVFRFVKNLENVAAFLGKRVIKRANPALLAILDDPGTIEVAAGEDGGDEGLVEKTPTCAIVENILLFCGVETPGSLNGTHARH
eukprot:g1869.t1